LASKPENPLTVLVDSTVPGSGIATLAEMSYRLGVAPGPPLVSTTGTEKLPWLVEDTVRVRLMLLPQVNVGRVETWNAAMLVRTPLAGTFG